MVRARVVDGRVLAPSLLAVVVAAPASGNDFTPFTQEAAFRGVIWNVGPLEDGNPGFGVGFADLDGDGDPDLIALGRQDRAIGIWENSGTGIFTARHIPATINAPVHTGVSAADYDRDGDVDLYISCWHGDNRLFRNDGDFVFTDVTAGTGLADGGAGCGLGWGDFDADGWLDVYVANRTGHVVPGGQPATEENRLFRNNRNGTFTDVAAALGVQSTASLSVQGTFFDYDGDLDQDLYVANRSTPQCSDPCRLFRNEGGTFTDVTETSNAGACVDAMSVAVGDFDGNLFQDVYVTNLPWGNALLLNQGDGTFERAAEVTGTQSWATGWAAQFVDLDHDTIQELYVVNSNAPDRLYRHEGSWPCEDIAAAVGLADPAQSYCCAYADVDGDGDLDLVTSATNAPLRLYINREGSERPWILFDVRAAYEPREAIGATIHLTAGGIMQMREMVSNAGFKTQNEHVLHFGLGDAEVVDTVTIRWPEGLRAILKDLPARQRYTITRACALDVDASGAVDARDISALLAHYGTPVAPGTRADVDASGIVDLRDLNLVLTGFGERCGE